MNRLMEDIRQAIKEERYSEFAEDFLEEYFSGKENKEFSNNIRLKYMEEEKKERAKILLDWDKSI